MRFYHRVSVEQSTLPPQEFEKLCRLKPECKFPTGFRYEVTTLQVEEDELLRRLLTLMREFSIPNLSISDSTHFGYEIVRDYEKSDFLSAEFLLLHYQRKLKRIDGPERDEQGRLVVWAGDNKHDLKFGSTYPTKCIVVSDVVRQFLKESGLTGLQFKPVGLRGESNKAVAAPPWELASSVTLPNLANTPQLMHYGRQADKYEPQPFEGDYSRPVFINDPPFRGAELHYRRSDLTALGAFDIAATFEHYMWPHPALVVSQRFYQHCLKQKIPLAVEPVRIDPD